MKFSLVYLLASFTLITSTITDCSKGLAKFTMINQGFSPDPPVIGQDSDLWYYYQVPDGLIVTGGTATYTATISGIPFNPTVDDLCAGSVTCPIVSGVYNLTSITPCPTGVSGKITIKTEWKDEVGSLLLCSLLSFRL